MIAFWHVWGNTISAILLMALPSVIIGLTNYPKAGGIVKALNVVLQVLSFLTHKDVPGTFKPPFTVKP